MERIQLRAFWAEMPNSDTYAGIALPDGRMLLWSGRSTAHSYSSERILLDRMPGARLFWNPEADEAINAVSIE
jgi:hypothetical protein